MLPLKIFRVSHHTPPLTFLHIIYVCQVPDALSDKVLELECPETGRVLECYAERFAVVNGQRYLAAYPKARKRIQFLTFHDDLRPLMFAFDGNAAFFEDRKAFSEDSPDTLIHVFF